MLTCMRIYKTLISDAEFLQVPILYKFASMSTFIWFIKVLSFVEFGEFIICFSAHASDVDVLNIIMLPFGKQHLSWLK